MSTKRQFLLFFIFAATALINPISLIGAVDQITTEGDSIINLENSTATFTARGFDFHFYLRTEKDNKKSPGYLFILGGWSNKNNYFIKENIGSVRGRKEGFLEKKSRIIPSISQNFDYTVTCINRKTISIAATNPDTGITTPLLSYTDEERMPEQLWLSMESSGNNARFSKPIRVTQDAPAEFTITGHRTQMPYRFSFPDSKRTHLSFQAKTSDDAYLHFYGADNKEKYRVSIGADGRNRTLFFREGNLTHRSPDNKGLIENSATTFGHYTVSFDNGFIQVYAGTTAGNRALVAEWLDTNPLDIAYVRFGNWDPAVTIKTIQTHKNPYVAAAPDKFTITGHRMQAPYRFSVPHSKQTHISFQAKTSDDAYLHFYGPDNKEKYRVSIGAEGKNRTLFFREGNLTHRSSDNKGLIENSATTFGHYTVSFDNGFIEVYAGVAADKRELVAEWRDINPLDIAYVRFGNWDPAVTIAAVHTQKDPYVAAIPTEFTITGHRMQAPYRFSLPHSKQTHVTFQAKTSADAFLHFYGADNKEKYNITIGADGHNRTKISREGALTHRSPDNKGLIKNSAATFGHYTVSFDNGLIQVYAGTTTDKRALITEWLDTNPLDIAYVRFGNWDPAVTVKTVQTHKNPYVGAIPTEFTITGHRTQLPYRFSLPDSKQTHLSFEAKTAADVYVHFYDADHKEKYRLSIGADNVNRTIFFREGTLTHRSPDNKGLIENSATRFGHYTISFNNGLIQVYGGTNADNRKLIAQWEDKKYHHISYARFGNWSPAVTIKNVQTHKDHYAMSKAVSPAVVVKPAVVAPVSTLPAKTIVSDKIIKTQNSVVKFSAHGNDFHMNLRTVKGDNTKPGYLFVLGGWNNKKNYYKKSTLDGGALKHEAKHLEEKDLIIADTSAVIEYTMTFKDRKTLTITATDSRTNTTTTVLSYTDTELMHEELWLTIGAVVPSSRFSEKAVVTYPGTASVTPATPAVPSAPAGVAASAATTLTAKTTESDKIIKTQNSVVKFSAHGNDFHMNLRTVKGDNTKPGYLFVLGGWNNKKNYYKKSALDGGALKHEAKHLEEKDLIIADTSAVIEYTMTFKDRKTLTITATDSRTNTTTTVLSYTDTELMHEELWLTIGAVVPSSRFSEKAVVTYPDTASVTPATPAVPVAPAVITAPTVQPVPAVVPSQAFTLPLEAAKTVRFTAHITNKLLLSFNINGTTKTGQLVLFPTGSKETSRFERYGVSGKEVIEVHELSNTYLPAGEQSYMLYVHENFINLVVNGTVIYKNAFANALLCSDIRFNAGSGDTVKDVVAEEAKIAVNHYKKITELRNTGVSRNVYYPAAYLKKDGTTETTHAALSFNYPVDIDFEVAGQNVHLFLTYNTSKKRFNDMNSNHGNYKGRIVIGDTTARLQAWQNGKVVEKSVDTTDVRPYIMTSYRLRCEKDKTIVFIKQSGTYKAIATWDVPVEPFSHIGFADHSSNSRSIGTVAQRVIFTSAPVVAPKTAELPHTLPTISSFSEDDPAQIDAAIKELEQHKTKEVQRGFTTTRITNTAVVARIAELTKKKEALLQKGSRTVVASEKLSLINGQLSFEATGNDIYIQLQHDTSKLDSAGYHLVLGGWSNSKGRLQRWGIENGAPKLFEEKFFGKNPFIPVTDQKVTITVKALNGVITVMATDTAGTQHELISYTNKEFSQRDAQNIPAEVSVKVSSWNNTSAFFHGTPAVTVLAQPAPPQPAPAATQPVAEPVKEVKKEVTPTVPVAPAAVAAPTPPPLTAKKAESDKVIKTQNSVVNFSAHGNDFHIHLRTVKGDNTKPGYLFVLGGWGNKKNYYKKSVLDSATLKHEAGHLEEKEIIVADTNAVIDYTMTFKDRKTLTITATDPRTNTTTTVLSYTDKELMHEELWLTIIPMIGSSRLSDTATVTYPSAPAAPEKAGLTQQEVTEKIAAIEQQITALEPQRTKEVKGSFGMKRVIANMPVIEQINKLTQEKEALLREHKRIVTVTEKLSLVNGQLSFEATGNDVYIQLQHDTSKLDSPGYHLVLGGWSNSKGRLQRWGIENGAPKLFEEKLFDKNPFIPVTDQKVTITVKALNGVITVMATDTAGTQHELISYTNKEFSQRDAQSIPAEVSVKLSSYQNTSAFFHGTPAVTVLAQPAPPQPAPAATQPLAEPVKEATPEVPAAAQPIAEPVEEVKKEVTPTVPVAPAEQSATATAPTVTEKSAAPVKEATPETPATPIEEKVAPEAGVRTLTPTDKLSLVNGQLSFEVTGNDIYVQLQHDTSKLDSPGYHLVLGGWSNSKGRLQRWGIENGAPKLFEEKFFGKNPFIPVTDQKVTIMVKALNGVITVTATDPAGTQHELISYTNKEFSQRDAQNIPAEVPVKVSSWNNTSAFFHGTPAVTVLAQPAPPQPAPAATQPVAEPVKEVKKEVTPTVPVAPAEQSATATAPAVTEKSAAPVKEATPETPATPAEEKVAPEAGVRTLTPTDKLSLVNGQLSFEVTGNDIYVQLQHDTSKLDSPGYHLVLGGWSNSKGRLQRWGIENGAPKLFEEKFFDKNPFIPVTDQKVTITVKALNGVITVMGTDTAGTQHELISYTNKEFSQRDAQNIPAEVSVKLSSYQNTSALFHGTATIQTLTPVTDISFSSRFTKLAKAQTAHDFLAELRGLLGDIATSTESEQKIVLAPGDHKKLIDAFGFIVDDREILTEQERSYLKSLLMYLQSSISLTPAFKDFMPHIGDVNTLLSEVDALREFKERVIDYAEEWPEVITEPEDNGERVRFFTKLSSVMKAPGSKDDATIAQLRNDILTPLLAQSLSATERSIVTTVQSELATVVPDSVKIREQLESAEQAQSISEYIALITDLAKQLREKKVVFSEDDYDALIDALEELVVDREALSAEELAKLVQAINYVYYSDGFRGVAKREEELTTLYRQVQTVREFKDRVTAYATEVNGILSLLPEDPDRIRFFAKLKVLPQAQGEKLIADLTKLTQDIIQPLSATPLLPDERQAVDEVIRFIATEKARLEQAVEQSKSATALLATIESDTILSNKITALRDLISQKRRQEVTFTPADTQTALALIKQLVQNREALHEKDISELQRLINLAYYTNGFNDNPEHNKELLELNQLVQVKRSFSDRVTDYSTQVAAIAVRPYDDAQRVMFFDKLETLSQATGEKTAESLQKLQEMIIAVLRKTPLAPDEETVLTQLTTMITSSQQALETSAQAAREASLAFNLERAQKESDTTKHLDKLEAIIINQRNGSITFSETDFDLFIDALEEMVEDREALTADQIKKLQRIINLTFYSDSVKSNKQYTDELGELYRQSSKIRNFSERIDAYSREISEITSLSPTEPDRMRYFAKLRTLPQADGDKGTEARKKLNDSIIADLKTRPLSPEEQLVITQIESFMGAEQEKEDAKAAAEAARLASFAYQYEQALAKTSLAEQLNAVTAILEKARTKKEVTFTPQDYQTVITLLSDYTSQRDGLAADEKKALKAVAHSAYYVDGFSTTQKTTILNLHKEIDTPVDFATRLSKYPLEVTSIISTSSDDALRKRFFVKLASLLDAPGKTTPSDLEQILTSIITPLEQTMLNAQEQRVVQTLKERITKEVSTEKARLASYQYHRDILYDKVVAAHALNASSGVDTLLAGLNEILKKLSDQSITMTTADQVAFAQEIAQLVGFKDGLNDEQQALLLGIIHAVTSNAQLSAVHASVGAMRAQVEKKRSYQELISHIPAIMQTPITGPLAPLFTSLHIPHVKAFGKASGTVTLELLQQIERNVLMPLTSGSYSIKEKELLKELREWLTIKERELKSYASNQEILTQARTVTGEYNAFISLFNKIKAEEITLEQADIADIIARLQTLVRERIFMSSTQFATTGYSELKTVIQVAKTVPQLASELTQLETLEQTLTVNKPLVSELDATINQLARIVTTQVDSPERARFFDRLSLFGTQMASERTAAALVDPQIPTKLSLLAQSLATTITAATAAEKVIINKVTNDMRQVSAAIKQVQNAIRRSQVGNALSSAYGSTPATGQVSTGISGPVATTAPISVSGSSRAYLPRSRRRRR